MSDDRPTGPGSGPTEEAGRDERAEPVSGPDAAVESVAAGAEPEAAEPEAAEPEAAEPEVAEPEVARPEAAGPEVAEPEVAGPGEVGSPVLALVPEPAAGADEVAADDEAGGLPDLSDESEFEGALESILLVVDTPIAEEQLAAVLEQSVKRVTTALHRLAARYTERNSGIDLRRIGDGWRFYTRDRFAPFVEKLLLDGQRAKLTRAALETLAVIAYRQPVTRARIAAVRGVNVDGVIRTLVARGLIAETGTDSDTGGILYRTTELFLERLGLSSLSDLPPIAPLLPEVDAIDDV
ncbi:SMC-Scp complex subunit ScpB [Saccharothrix stipae]